MAINKKLIHFQTMANFEAQLSAGNILDTSIVFIKDAKKILTHGEFYDCGGVDDIDIPTKLSELENDAGYVQRDPNTGFVELNDWVYVDERAIVARTFQDTLSRAYMLINSDGSITTYDSNDDSALKLYTSYDGTKFLADDGKYKTALTEHQDISGKQDKLVSGTNIKTINGTSLLGEGDIAISGGIAEETDPIFSASPAATITDEKIEEWDGKQDVLVSGTNIKTINGTSLLGSGNITVATQAYVDSKIGDINTILESIISGGGYYGLAQYSEEELLNIVDEALEE